MAPASQKSGHLFVALEGGCPRKLHRIHRLVAAAFIGPCPKGQQVRHLDGKPWNNVMGNLAYGTPTQNRLDMRLHGTARRGLNNHFGKYSDEVICEAIRLRASGMTCLRVAQLTGITKSYVWILGKGGRRHYLSNPQRVDLMLANRKKPAPQKNLFGEDL
jgi:hypothetical protein